MKSSPSTRLVLVIMIVIVIGLPFLAGTGCTPRPPCDEPLDEPAGDVALVASHVEPGNVKLVHYVSFDMGPIQETLTGYMIVRAPDALRLYGMSETGQKVFDLAINKGKVKRLYRAPFLQDDRVLDMIADAAGKIFLLRPPAKGVEFSYQGRAMHLRWLRGEKFSACFMDWSDEDGVYAPRRIHFRSDEGPYPYELRMKLVEAKVLAAPAPDVLFAGE